MEHYSSPAGTGHDSQVRLIKIDSEHFSIRFLLPVLTIILLIVVHLAISSLVNSAVDGVNPLCVALPADIAVLILGSMGIERLLKRALPSRRNALLSRDTLVMTDARKNPPDVVTIDWEQPLNVRAWRFEIQRRGRRVPRGWSCMAIQLLQDESDVIVYTFMPQKEAEAAIGYSRFVRLRPRKETQSNTDLNMVAEQRRLLKLEDARWNDGAEVVRVDFNAILAHIQRVVPDWR